jgi:hypothetical protein
MVKIDQMHHFGVPHIPPFREAERGAKPETVNLDQLLLDDLCHSCSADH